MKLNLKIINIKNCECHYFDDIMKDEDINVNNILLDEKSYENILVYNILSKESWMQNHCVLGSIK